MYGIGYGIVSKSWKLSLQFELQNKTRVGIVFQKRLKKISEEIM
jgi:hypothetical protein